MFRVNAKKSQKTKRSSQEKSRKTQKRSSQGSVKERRRSKVWTLCASPKEKIIFYTRSLMSVMRSVAEVDPEGEVQSLKSSWIPEKEKRSEPSVLIRSSLAEIITIHPSVCSSVMNPLSLVMEYDIII